MQHCQLLPRQHAKPISLWTCHLSWINQLVERGKGLPQTVATKLESTLRSKIQLNFRLRFYFNAKN